MSRWTIGWWAIAAGWEALLLALTVTPRLDGWLALMIVVTVAYGLVHICQALDGTQTPT